MAVSLADRRPGRGALGQYGPLHHKYGAERNTVQLRGRHSRFRRKIGIKSIKLRWCYGLSVYTYRGPEYPAG